jgi:hypothetical protein
VCCLRCCCRLPWGADYLCAANCGAVVRLVFSAACWPLLGVWRVVAAVSNALTASRISTEVMSAAPANLGGMTCNTPTRQHPGIKNALHLVNLAHP